METGFNWWVRSFAVHGNDLYVGGAFTEAGGRQVGRLARWDGASWRPAGPGFNDHVWALTTFGGNIIAGGAFTRAGGVEANFIAIGG
jgi:hypothetical protein